MLAFAMVVGLLGIRAALVDAALYVIVPIIAVSTVLLLANGPVMRRSWLHARHDIDSGARTIRPGPALAASAATAVLALASLAVLALAAPPP